MKDLSSIEYLREGSEVQQQAYKALKRLGIMDKLKPFDPILAGTFPLGIQVDGSDLDIICSFSDPEDFRESIRNAFEEIDYEISEKEIRGRHSIICRFSHFGYEWEIFAQQTPSRDQMAVRHLMIESEVLKKKGKEFKEKVIELKNQGMSTEEAFANLLGLEGDPYLALLEYAKQSL